MKMVRSTEQQDCPECRLPVFGGRCPTHDDGPEYVMYGGSDNPEDMENPEREGGESMEASEANQASPAWYIAAVVIPIVGIILAIIQFNRNHIGPAFGLLLTSLVAAIVWSVLLLTTYSATHEGNGDRYTNCVMQAQTYKEQLNCPL